MSQVFSFRLDENNPREAQAIQIIQAWASRGYSIRFTVVEALLTVDKDKTLLENISITLDQINTILQKLQDEPHSQNNLSSKDADLSETFVSAVLKTSRPGLRI